MSTIRADKLQWTDGTDRNHVIQTATTVITSVYSDSADQNPQADFTVLPTNTTGLLLANLTFTPKRSDSLLIFETSSINVFESTNSGDDFRLFIHAGVTLMCWGYSGIKYSSFSGNQNAMQMGLYGFAYSWGTTGRSVRFALQQSGNGNLWVNQRYGGTSWLVNPIRLTVTEIEK